MQNHVSADRYYDLDLGAKFLGDREFELYDWETSQTTQFLTSEEREALYIKHKGLCESRAVYFASSRGKYDVEDLTSQANVAFTDALNGYDPRKGELCGAAFATYAFTCINNALGRYTKKLNRRMANEVSMEDQIAEDSNGHVESWEDTIADDAPNIQTDIQRQEAIKEVISLIQTQLDDADYYILTHTYGLNNEPIMTQSQIAHHLRMSQANVSKRCKHALTAMKIMILGKYGSDAKNFFGDIYTP